VSVAGATVSRPRARLARLGTARLAVSLPKSMLALSFLIGVSLALRTQAIHARFWIDEGLSVGIASHPLSAIPGVQGSPETMRSRSVRAEIFSNQQLQLVAGVLWDGVAVGDDRVRERAAALASSRLWH